jgi:hypothetical protein
MPPRKQLKRKSGACVTASSGEVANSVGDLPRLMLEAKEWIENVYARRHKTQETCKPEELMDPPVCHGGTFKDIAQRAWNDGVSPQLLLGDALNLLIGAKFLPDGASIDDMGEKFMAKDICLHHLYCLGVFYVSWGVFRVCCNLRTQPIPNNVAM